MSADWRLSEDIARDQAAAAAAAIYPRLEELDGEDMNAAQIAQDPDEGKHAWVVMASEIIRDAILANNRRHYDEIQAALADLRRDALTDAEVEDLLR